MSALIFRLLAYIWVHRRGHNEPAAGPLQCRSMKHFFDALKRIRKCHSPHTCFSAMIVWFLLLHHGTAVCNKACGHLQAQCDLFSIGLLDCSRQGRKKKELIFHLLRKWALLHCLLLFLGVITRSWLSSTMPFSLLDLLKCVPHLSLCQPIYRRGEKQSLVDNLLSFVCV